MSEEELKADIERLKRQIKPPAIELSQSEDAALNDLQGNGINWFRTDPDTKLLADLIRRIIDRLNA